MKAYSAMLLFQFRVVVDGDSGKRRTCEERIILLEARSARLALAQAKREGRGAQYSYLNSDGNWVYFEFVGVMELLQLGPECGEGEVWYEIRERLLPMERKQELLKAEQELCAIRCEAQSRVLTRERGERVHGPRRSVRPRGRVHAE
jgi:hypothetical protein